MAGGVTDGSDITPPDVTYVDNVRQSKLGVISDDKIHHVRFRGWVPVGNHVHSSAFEIHFDLNNKIKKIGLLVKLCVKAVLTIVCSLLSYAW